MKGAGQKTQSTMPDKDMIRYREEVYNKARDVGNDPYQQYMGQRVAGADGMSGQAAAGMGGMADAFGRMRANFGMGGPNISPYEQAGAVGAGALAGDQGSIDKLMNPYQRQVIDAMGTEYDRMRGKAELGSNAAATRGGAFGGSRHALMTGERLGAIDRAQGSEIANLLHGGYNDMMGRASAGANLGLGGLGLGSQHALGMGGLGIDAGRAQTDALGQQFGMGDYFRGLNQNRLDANYGDFLERRGWKGDQLGRMNSVLTGSPYGQTTSEPMQRNAFSGALGGAVAGSKFGPWGAAAGGLGGLLFG